MNSKTNPALQLSLMKPSEAVVSADILKKAHSSWEEVPVAFYDEQILPALVQALENRLVVVGKNGGRIRAAYDLPDFVREDGSIVLGKGKQTGFFGTTYSGLDGYFAVDEERRGIGTAFFASFENLLEQLALQSGGLLLHRVTATHRSRMLFEKQGYVSVHYLIGLRTDYYTMEHMHQPVQHALSSGERIVVDAMLALVNQQVGAINCLH